MMSSSSSLSSVHSYCSLDSSGMMIWYACFGSPLYCCCDCGCAFFVKQILVVSNFIAGFALVLLCRAVESFWMLLPLWLILFVWAWFLTTFFLLGWQASVVVSQYIDIRTTLHVGCMLFDVFGSGFA